MCHYVHMGVSCAKSAVQLFISGLTCSAIYTLFGSRAKAAVQLYIPDLKIVAVYGMGISCARAQKIHDTIQFCVVVSIL